MPTSFLALNYLALICIALGSGHDLFFADYKNIYLELLSSVPTFPYIMAAMTPYFLPRGLGNAVAVGLNGFTALIWGGYGIVDATDAAGDFSRSTVLVTAAVVSAWNVYVLVRARTRTAPSPAVSRHG